MENSVWKNRWLGALAALLGYGLLVMLRLDSDILRLRTEILSDSLDGVLHWWNVWWTRRALQHSANPFWCDLLWYPAGTPLLYDSTTPANGVFWTLYCKVFSETLAYNVLVLQSYVLGGFFFWLLLRSYDLSWMVSFAGGILFTLSPFHFSHTIGHLNLASIQWIPLFLFAWKSGLEDSRHFWKLLAGVSLLLVIGAEFLFLFFVAPIAFAMAIREYFATRHDRDLRKSFLRNFFGLMLVLMIFLGPWLGAMAYELMGNEYTEGRNAAGFSADLLSYFVYGTFSAWGKFTEPVWQNFQGKIYVENAGGLGVVTMIGILLSLVRRPRESAMWHLLALLFAALSFGPILAINGKVTDVPTLYGWLVKTLPWFALMGTPVRYIFPASFCWYVAACIGWHDLLMARTSARTKTVLGGLLIVACVVDLWPVRFPLADIRLTEPELAEMEKIRSEAGKFAILEAPANDSNLSSYAKYLQCFHERPLIGGYVSRRRKNLELELAATPVVAVFYGLRELTPFDLPPEKHRDLFPKLAIRYLIVMKTQEQFDKLALQMGFEREFSSPNFRVYRIPASTAEALK